MRLLHPLTGMRREAAGRAMNCPSAARRNRWAFETAQFYGTVAETSDESALSTPLELTEVTT